MKTNLLGVQKINFTNNDGEVINGTNIFVAFADENVKGYRTEKFFVKENIALPKGIQINDTIDLSFNHKGKIESINKVD